MNQLRVKRILACLEVFFTAASSICSCNGASGSSRLMHCDYPRSLQARWRPVGIMSEVPSGLEVAMPEPRPVRPSSSLMLTRDGVEGVEVLLCRRVDELPAFAGYWSFPGGGISRVDISAAETHLGGMTDRDLAASLVGMMRELVEELGWVIVDGSIENADTEARKNVLASKGGWLAEVESGRLPCDYAGLTTIDRRTTPNFAPIRFDNRFLHFHAGSGEYVPEPNFSGQTEFDSHRWARPSQFLDEWRENTIKIPPPIITVLLLLEELLLQYRQDISLAVKELSAREGERPILFAHGVECIPVPTHTLPPASTTNTYILGIGGDHIIVDAAARTAEGLAMIGRAVERVKERGGRIVGLLFTHRHLDHVGDIAELQKLGPFPVLASAETAVALPWPVETILADGDTISLPGTDGTQEWRVLITPGHCPGHICLLNASGLVAGDMVAGIGTILIPPEEGNMEQYLEQLVRLAEMQPHLIFPSHGVVLPLPEKTFNHYIEHRRKRHQLVLEAVISGTTELSEISQITYSDSPEAHPGLARQQTLSHLLSHARAGALEQRGDGWYTR